MKPAVLAALAASVFLGGACARPGSSSRRAAEPVQRLLGLTLSQTFQGAPVWDLSADSAILADQETKATAQSPRMTFFRDGKAASKLTAVTGVIGLKDRDVLLSSSVVVVSLDDQSRLQTEELRFISSRRKFFTDKEVLVNRPGAVLRGSGLEATPDLSEIRVFNQRSVIDQKGVPR